MTIGKRIRQKREALQLTQNDVADKLFVTQQTVARWESDKHTPPLKAVQDLADLFQVDVAYFFGEDRIVVHKFNFFALFGSLTFNFLFFWIVAVALISIQLAFWGAAGACFIGPGVVIWQAVTGIRALTFWRALGGLGLTAFACLIMPLLWKMTRYMWRILKAYYRYNVNAIFYEVVPREQAK
ncbi:helix-turn-helix domain-containing protein [Lacticaseibacillus daqingensis]|uniref:helix-turn-helix domain-containing protein n=1 Tax=Lacticaseibacillus daqingensis TaxID=2486014 RepID=UPI000F76F3A6|nr:helix-turn-helix domain-containing protein [Lacticaseibacillus daqingensis]